MLPDFTAPESHRADLSGALLQLMTLGVDKPVAFDWLSPRPPPAHMGQAAERLVALGAIELASNRPNGPQHLTRLVEHRARQLATICASCGLDTPAAASALLGAAEEGCTKEMAAILALMQQESTPNLSVAKTGFIVIVM
ncbi:unnamed protein product [Protopolystoma xenopodis]|uniref:Helicase-associated domain-containing protein n=1 Tax=Protopolystoma xenopodis TaxID=117903 RepID=A0A3S5FCG9_9PLAT|nr:unnamed protein product [Protopolystoma xenopodis]